MFYDINYKLRSIPINCKWLWIEGNKDTYFLIHKLDIGAQDHCKNYRLYKQHWVCTNGIDNKK